MDEPTFARARKLLSRLLRGGTQLSRAAIYQALETAKISAAGRRGIHILWRLAHEGLNLLRRARGEAADVRAARRMGAAAKEAAAERSAGRAGAALFCGARPGDRRRFQLVVGLAARRGPGGAGAGQIGARARDIAIALSLFGSLGKRERQALAAPAKRFGRFLGKPVVFAG